MKISGLHTFSLGPLAVNAYLLYASDSHALLIDAPQGVEEVSAFIKRKRYILDAVLLTHGHFDHIQGLSHLDVPFYIHEDDAVCISNEELNLSCLMEEPFIVQKHPCIFREGPLCIGTWECRVLHTPGHTPGSVSFLFDDMLFSGDTLFFGSVGRTDIPRGSHQTLISSIRGKLMCLDDTITVYPGHGPSTSLGKERAGNEFITE